MRAASIATALALACACASAQSPNPYEGIWKATWDGRIRQFEATVVIKGDAGTWKTSARDRNDPCVGLEVPIVVSEASPQLLVFKADFDKVIAGCSGFTVSVTPRGSELEGKRGAFAVRMVRN
ncbi:hypothetical protein [Ramlibacter sp. WS9]|uniref:hypothetical protein n=1 Tax=Ramlibacter sp. WS9 TaxID=1882741 RepID=UPI001141D54D|nr:hypothetical protein [Ramlibacter sp. WS9]ROZ64933.1 hypothetical protein EEB15_27675 [Ramlibacter sp. WS9]